MPSNTKTLWIVTVIGLLSLAAAVAFMLSGGAAAHDVPLDGSIASGETTATNAPAGGGPAIRGVQRNSTVRSGGFYSAAVGSEFVFSMKAESAFRMGGEGAGELVTVLEGGMKIVVIARDTDSITMAITLPQLQANTSGALKPKTDAWEKELMRAADGVLIVRMTPDGTTLGYGFPSGLMEETRNLLRTVISGFRFVVPMPLTERWTAEESDAGGKYSSDYALEGDAAAKTVRVRRTRAKDNDGKPDEQGALKTPSGSASATLDKTIGWLRSVECDESMLLEVPSASLQARHRFVGSLQLKQAGVAAAAELAALKELLQRPLGAVDGVADHDSSKGEAAIAEAWRKRIAGASVDGLLSEIESLLQHGKADSREMFEAIEKLSWLVKLDGTALDKVLALATAGGVSDAAAAALLQALGMAATPAAQAGLARLATDTNLPEARRIAAAQAMFSLEHPTSEAAASVAALLAQPNLSTAMQGTALLLLGAMVNFSGGSPQLLATLLAYEQNAAQHGLTEAWLEAIGNAGFSQFLPQLLPYLTNANENVRAAALAALRNTTAAEALQAMAALAINDSSTTVRMAAAENLANHLGPTTVAALNTVLQNDASTEVRQRALLALGQYLNQGPNHTLAQTMIQWTANNDPSGNLRTQAAQMLQ